MTQLIQIVQVGEKKKAQPLATNKFDVDMSEFPKYDDQLSNLAKKVEA